MASHGDRIGALERRVDELGARLDGDPVEAAAGPVAEDLAERFWALEALRRRVRGPGGVVYAGIVDTPSGEHFEWQYGHAVSDFVDADPAELDAAARRLSALGHPARLAILTEVLARHSKVGELVALPAFATTGQVYHHINILTGVGWLESAGRGVVRVPADRVVPVLVAIGASR